MRMKFNKSGQLLLVSAASLLIAGLLTACSTLTVDFVYVTSSLAAGPNSYGEVDVMEVNSESGFSHRIPTSPFPSGGRNPVAEAVSTNFTNLYVVNHDDNTIVQFAIGNDGKLYPQNTVNTPGIFPMGIAISGSTLYALDTYQPLPSCSPASPCSGSVAVFPLSASGQPGAPITNGDLTYWPLALPGKADIMVPTAINVLASGSLVYVTAYDSSVSPTVGYIFGFSSAAGVLTPLNGGAPVVASGTFPSAIASDPGNQFVYVTDFSKAAVMSYAVQANGALTEVSGSPFSAGSQPTAITVDSSGQYLYVVNSLDNDLMAYSIANGSLTRLGSYATGTQPDAIVIDPSTHHYIYTANFLSANLSGFQLNPTTGTLINTQNVPYGVSAQPTALAAIPHGSQLKQ